MKLARALASAFTFLFVISLALPAFAAGSITYARKEIQESNGGWNLVMTVAYGGTPQTAHVPVRFTFTPTAILERYLDDAHGDKPQTRKIPLVGQMPLNESVDIDFSDPRGKLYNKTRFDFTITRAHNFVAGDYSVSVHRADGTALGGPQTISLHGENTIIDRRAISFVAGAKKNKPDAGAAAAAPADKSAAAGETASSESATAPAAAEATEGSDGGATEAKPEEGNAADPAALEKVPPSSKGCGCRLSASSSGNWGVFGLTALFGTIVWRLRRRPGSL
jgi:hypothetical protein